MSELKEVIISITNRCNLNCRICDIPKERTQELPTSYWKGVIEDASSIGVSTIVFSGGEPLLRADLLDLISFTKEKNMSACITSNGLLISDETAAALAERRVNVINISLEGPKDIHDYLRGEGSFDKAIAALNNLKKHNIESTVAMVVCRYNYKYLASVVELAKEVGATTIKFQPFNDLFLKNKSRKADFLPSKEEALELNNVIKEVILLCNKYGIATNPSSYLERIPKYLTNNNSSCLKGCPALWASCPINSKGEIYPCWVLSNNRNLIGSVKAKRFSELWGSSRHNNLRKSILKKGCPECMMSCYDAAFGKDSLEEKITRGIAKIRKEGFLEYSQKIWQKNIKRFKFYISYQGSLNSLIKRIKIFLKKKISSKKQVLNQDVNIEEVKKALADIALAKKLLKKEKFD